jgi:hypothetical protein
LERFNEYKEMLLNEFIETKEQEMDAEGDLGQELEKSQKSAEIDEKMEAADIETLIS